MPYLLFLKMLQNLKSLSAVNIGGALKVKLSTSSSGFLNNPSKNKIPNDPRQEKKLYGRSKISNNVACQKEV